MAITPIDIQQHQFKTRPVGYEKGGVDHYLEQVAEELENYHRQVQELKEELVRTKAALQEMRQRESAVKETLLTAQQLTEEIKTNAHKEAGISLAEAELEAERIVYHAECRRKQLLDEIREIKCQKISFESALRGLVEGHLRLLDIDRLDEGESTKIEQIVTGVEPSAPGALPDLNESGWQDR
jgi:cell division initiation protein